MQRGRTTGSNCLKLVNELETQRTRPSLAGRVVAATLRNNDGAGGKLAPPIGGYCVNGRQQLGAEARRKLSSAMP